MVRVLGPLTLRLNPETQERYGQSLQPRFKVVCEKDYEFFLPGLETAVL